MNKAAILLAVSLVACGGNDTCDPNAPGTICTIAGHSLTEGYRGDGGPATEADLYLPMDSAISPDGEVWFIDFNNYVVRAIDKHGNIRTVVGTGLLGDSPVSDHLPQIPASQSTNNHTSTMVFSGGYLYLSAWHESRIKRVRLSDMEMEVYAGRGVRQMYDGDGGPAIDAALDLPSGLAIDPAGNIVTVDQGNQVIRRIDGGQIIHTIAGQCITDFDQPCAPGETPVACSGSDKLACGDTAVSCMGVCAPAFAGDGGPATLARFDMPFGQATDPCGHIAYTAGGDLIIADTGNNRIRKIAADGTITTIAGTGLAGYGGDGGLATDAALHHPIDVATAPDGTIYFSDTFNHCIRAIDPDGRIHAVAGRCHSSQEGEGGTFAGDGGPPLEAEMNRPYGIDLEGKKLYVSDTYNNRLRVVNLP